MTREEIMTVVRDAVRDTCGMGPWKPHPEVCDAVATRVADKLVPLTEMLSVLDQWCQSGKMTDDELCDAWRKWRGL